MRPASSNEAEGISKEGQGGNSVAVQVVMGVDDIEWYCFESGGIRLCHGQPLLCKRILFHLIIVKCAVLNYKVIKISQSRSLFVIIFRGVLNDTS